MSRRLVWLLIVFFSLVIVFTGCDKIKKCYPTADAKRQGLGFKCVGKF